MIPTARLVRAPVEYRVMWRREGLRRKYVRKVTWAAVQKLVANLAAYDAHLRCEHETGYCDPMPPLVEGPVVERRERLPWLAITDEPTEEEPKHG